MDEASLEAVLAEQDKQRQHLGSPETIEALTSILAEVEAQNARLDRLAEQQTNLARFVKVMDEETTRRLERITAPPSTSSPSSDVSERITSRQSLIAEVQRNHAAMTAACEALKVQADKNRAFVSRVGGAVQRIEKRTEEHVQKAVEQLAGDASATMTANLDAANERAERIIATAAKVEARQLWSAVAAMLLVLLPLAMLVAGVWMAVAGLVTGAQWALIVDGSVWLGIGHWLVVGAASPGPATTSSPRSAGWSASRRRGGPRGADVAALAQIVQRGSCSDLEMISRMQATVSRRHSLFGGALGAFSPLR